MLKRAIFILAVIVAVLAAGFWGTQTLLRFCVSAAVERALGGIGATVETGRVKVDLLGRSVSLRGVRIRAQGDNGSSNGGSGGFSGGNGGSGDLSRGISPLVALDVSLESVSVQGVRLGKGEGKLALSAEKFVIAAPRATLVTRRVGKGAPFTFGAQGTSDAGPAATSTHATGPIPLENLRAMLSEKLSAFSIGTVEVTGAALELVQWAANNEKRRLTLDGGRFSARNITLDSLPADIRAGADSVVCLFGAGSKILRADGVAIDAAAGTLAVDSLALVPQFPKNEFARRVASHEDWTRIRLGQIAFCGVDYARLLRERSLAVDSVSLARADVASFKNRQVYQPPHIRPMLYEVIQRLPVPLDIEVVSFADIDVFYEELVVGGTSPGSVAITGGHGTATNITNIADGNDRFMIIDCTALFMHSGEVAARCLFPVAATDDAWELYGRLGPTDMAAMNRVIEPVAHLRITSGRIESCEFHVTGTSVRSHSRLTMKYNDLKVAVLDPNDHTRTREFLTVVADGVLIRPDNPGRHGDGHLREATGNHTREPERSMWEYMWRSLFPAIIKTVI